MVKAKAVLIFLSWIFFVSASEINWNSFEEGLKKAKKEKKLILVDIYAQWCHWCNVIENTTYRDKTVVDTIKKYYIPVRVDAEKEPDINKKYNQGGLPTTVILNENGELIWGSGRYISPEDMIRILNFYGNLPEEKLQKIAEKNKKKKEKFLKRFSKKVREKEISPYVIEKTFRYVKFKFDEQYGGFKGAPKFPVDELPYFLMLYTLFNKDVSKMVKKTLDGYAKIIDPVEGGIYRYSTTAFWSKPHYEKLLKDQGEISILFFNGYSFTGEKKYLDYALSLINFTENRLYSPEKGFFYNSQGADIVDEKGTILMSGEEFFPKNKEDRETAVSILGFSPKIEKNIYLSNNSIAVRSFLYGYAYTENKKLKEKALRVLDNILKYGFTEKGIKYSPDIEKFLLNTQIYTLEALLTAYQITGNKKYLERSIYLFDILKKYYYSQKLKIFTDPEDGGVSFSKISFIDDIINLNYRLAKSLYMIFLFTNQENYKETADSIIKRLPVKGNLSVALSYFLYLKPPLAVHIVDKDKKLINEAFKIFPFWVFVHHIPAEDKDLLIKMGYREKGIYVCNTDMCFFKKENSKLLKKEIFGIFKKYRQIK